MPPHDRRRLILHLFLTSLLLASCSRATGVGLPCGNDPAASASCPAGLVCDDGACDFAACAVDTDCLDPSAPWCDAGQCVACSDRHACGADAPTCSDGLCAACTADLDCEGADLPRCAASGACVACLDEGDCGRGQICDAGDCRGCVADAECAAGACDRATATCVPVEQVLYLAPDGDDLAPCDASAPCRDLGLALAAAMLGRPHIVLAPGAYAVTSATVFGALGGPRLTIHADGTTLAAADADGADRITLTDVALRIDGGRWMPGLWLAASGGRLEIADARLDGQYTVTRGDLALARVVAFDATFSAAHGAATLSRVAFSRSHLRIGPGPFTISDSSFVSSFDAAVRIVGDGAAGDRRLEFNTFVGNGAQHLAQTADIDCVAVTEPLVFRHNLVLATYPSHPAVTGEGCAFANSLGYPMTLAGADNLHVDPALVDAAGGDLRPTSASPALDAAAPDHVVPPGALDLAGAPRLIGVRADLGAYERQPDAP